MFRPSQHRSRLVFAALIAAVSLFGLAPSGASAGAPRLEPAPAGRQLPIARETKPILAWTSFCERYPAECRVDLKEPEVIRLTAQSWQMLDRVNRTVNAAIKRLSDQDHWGELDRWDLAEDGYGDCEDYQLLKRKLLAELGLPRRALRMTVVYDDKGEGHAVLMARTDRGDFILDNKTDRIVSWDRTKYTFVKREGADGARWLSLGGAVSPVATAN